MNTNNGGTMKAEANPSLAPGQTATIHVFERAGLGKAPFAFTGNVTEKVHCVPGGYPKAGSSCDYCGTGIRYEFWVRSADGREFKVGCDCIHKTGDRGLIRQIAVAERKLRDVKNAKARERKAERKAERIEAAKALLPTVRAALAEKPHPNSYHYNLGKSLLDYVRWCLDNGAGELAAGIIESHAK